MPTNVLLTSGLQGKSSTKTQIPTADSGDEYSFMEYSERIVSFSVSVLLQGSLVDREASDKERVKKHFDLFVFYIKMSLVTMADELNSSGKRASDLQGRGLQEQHAEGLRDRRAKGEVH